MCSLILVPLLIASTYDVVVPVGGYRTTPEALSCEFESVKKLDSERIVFVAGVMMRDEKKRAEIAECVRLNVIDAKREGFKETTAWFWSFWCSDTAGLTTMTASDGWRSPTFCCPLDPEFRKTAGAMMRDFVRTGVDMILLDDDFRYGNFRNGELVCTCARHMARIEERLGEKIMPADLKRKAMTGGRNRYRDAWMDVNGASFREYAAFLRACADEVNPNVRIGLCSCMSHWDYDGVDAATTARILAGRTRPFLRLIGAPYWASPQGPHYYGCNLQSVIEYERMERSWVTGGDIEVVSEGDTYPRPRWATGSSHLELFDLALRVDGRFDGILKYALDYDDPMLEDGYVVRHVRNRPLCREIALRFDGREAVGVRIYEARDRLREAVLEGRLAGNMNFLQTFGSAAAACCSDLAIPTVWEGEGLVGMAFGENVRSVPAEARRRGLVIDAWAARILMAQGVDVGVKDRETMEPAEGAEVIGPGAAGRPPFAFLTRNDAGERYLVLPVEAYWAKPDWRRNATAGRLLAEGIRRLAGRPLPAFLAGNPDVMLMAKDGSDGSRSVAVLNCFTDALVDAPIELDRAFDRVEFVNCRGRLEGSRVILDDVPAYGFAAFTVFPKAVKPIALAKRGTFDIGVVEANPIVFKGRLWLMEYLRGGNPNTKYRYNDTGASYFRFLDLSDMKTVTPPFGKGLHMGNAFVADDRVVVTAVEDWGRGCFYQLESTDLIHWTEPRVILENPAWQGYNTTVCRAGDRYVLAFELGAPAAEVKTPYTMFFAESTDLRDWKVIEGARMGEDRYTGAPMLRYFDGWFYFFHLEGGYEEGFKTRVARSRDLKSWTFSSKVVLGYGPEDRLIHPTPTVPFTAAEKEDIAREEDINASDFDMCEWNGGLVGFYSWGNQCGREFSALAAADCTEKEFCEGFFAAED